MSWTPPRHLDGLALARSTLDRLTEQRGDEDLVDALWADPRARVLSLIDGRAPVRRTSGELVYARSIDLPRMGTTAQDPPERLLLGVDSDGVPYFAVAADDPVGPPSPAVVDGLPMLSLREAGPLLNARDAGAFVHALALANWHATHRFCSRCGEPTEAFEGGHVRRCASCGAEHFPRTDPAIIVLVTDDADRALLGRGATWPEGRFSTLAGFVEPGESLEAAVIREVREETGIHVTDPGYVGSQPWPMPSSLMLGFFARAESIEIEVDGEEIAEAHWFSRDEYTRALTSGRVLSPSSVAISSRLIESWYGEPLPSA